MSMVLAGPAYAAALAEMHLAAFPDDPWSEADFAALLAQTGMAAFVDARGGFLLLRVVADEAEVITLGAVARRQGIGRALLQGALEYARARGVVRIFLEVAEGNAAALGLYAAFGFVSMGRRRGYYPDGGDALTMGLAISV